MDAIPPHPLHHILANYETVDIRRPRPDALYHWRAVMEKRGLPGKFVFVKAVDLKKLTLQVNAQEQHLVNATRHCHVEISVRSLVEIAELRRFQRHPNIVQLLDISGGPF